MIWYLYPTHAYRKPSALVFHLIKVWSIHTCRGRFCVQGLIVPQSLIYVFTHSGLRKHNPISEKYLTWWSLTWWWDLTWWSRNDKFKSKRGRRETSSGGKTLLRLEDYPVIYKTGTDWNWDVMGKESQEYLVKGLNPDHGMQYSHRLPLLTSIREPWKILLFAPVEVSNFEVHENTLTINLFWMQFSLFFLIIEILVPCPVIR